MPALSAAKTVSFILTADMPRAVAFYGDVLGLPFVEDNGFAHVFAMNGGTLRITHIDGHEGGPHPVLGWVVADVRTGAAALVAKGVKMEIYEGMGQDAQGIWDAPDGRTSLCFFKDPDGNVLSMAQ